MYFSTQRKARFKRFAMSGRSFYYLSDDYDGTVNQNGSGGGGGGHVDRNR